MKFIIPFLIVLIFCSIEGKARERPLTKQSFEKFLSTFYTEPVISTDSPSCIIPFTKAGNLIVIKAKADTTEGNFILDTGAPYLILNITYFRHYPASSASDEEQTSITGTGSAALKTTVNKFSLGTLNYHKADAHLISLGHIENSKGLKILGLIGMQLFKQCEMIIDHERSVIHLRHIKRKEATTYKHEMLKDASTYRTIPIDIMDDRIVARTEMAGKKLRFIIDCGAESTVLDSRLPDKIFEGVDITGRVLLTGTGNNKVEALTGELKNMKIGDQDFNAMPVLITNLEKTCFSYNGCIDGILGFDFLSAKKIGFNFVNRKMYIWK